MSSVVDELNELLAAERGEAEAVSDFIDELAEVDSDIAEGAKDVLQTASWSCSGLYRRITQTGGTPTLATSDLSTQLENKPDVRSRLEFLCETQVDDVSRIRALLNRKDLDRTTRQFLQDLKKAHDETIQWCKTTLDEWRRDE